MFGFFSDLPSGWSEAKDPQGNKYYYNTKTGEVRGTRRLGFLKRARANQPPLTFSDASLSRADHLHKTREARQKARRRRWPAAIRLVGDQG